MRALKRGLTAAVLLGAGFSVSACALLDNKSPVTTYRIMTAATDTAPLSVAVPLVARQTSGTQYNQWGGIIPEAKPTTPVDDDGLGEL